VLLPQQRRQLGDIRRDPPRRLCSFVAMSALPPKADIVLHGGNVRFVPTADMRAGGRSSRKRQITTSNFSESISSVDEKIGV
jgi:hypothetical protein